MSATWMAQGPAKFVTLSVQPVPWARARTNHAGHLFTPTPVARQQVAWRVAWADAYGTARLPHEAIAVVMAKFVVERPPSHFNTKGTLNATGRRRPIPPRGDIDNLLKLVLDALNDVAYRDDVQIVRVDGLEKVYTESPGEGPGVVVGFARAELLR